MKQCGSIFIFLLFIFSQSWGQDTLARKKVDKKLFIGVNFPGAGFSIWNIKGDNLSYYSSISNQGWTNKGFIGNGLNILYSLDVLLTFNKIKFGCLLGQEYFHIDKFENKKLQMPLQPVFSYYEQAHFQKILVELEYDLRKRKNVISLNMQAGWLLPENVFVHVDKAYTVNLGPVFSFYVNDRVDLIIRPYFDYKYLTHRVRQQDSYHGITFTQVDPDKTLYNNIYSFNVYFGLRVNLFKVEKYLVKSPRYPL